MPDSPALNFGSFTVKYVNKAPDHTIAPAAKKRIPSEFELEHQ